MHRWFKKLATADQDRDAVTVADDAPEWVRDAVHEAHCGDLPRDWIYAECAAAFEACESGELTTDESHDFADGRVDVYTRALWDWAAEFRMSNTWSDAEGEAEYMGAGEGGWDLDDRIKAIQFCAIRRIAEIIAQACADHEAEVES